MKIRDKLKYWLLEDEYERFNKAEDELKKTKEELDKYKQILNESNYKLNQSITITEDARRLINSICEVGVDIHRNPHNPDGSWAVICVHGKMDYVKFVPMAQRDIVSISQFLKQFKYSNRIEDTPMRFAVDDCINSW